MFSASARQPGRHRRGHGPAEAFAVLQDEEEPDRDDDESEQEGGRPDDRVDRRREQAGDDRCDDVARRGDLRVDRFADVRRQREALVPLDDRALDIADGRPEFGQLVHELAGLPCDRGHHEVEQRPDHGDRGGIEDDHAAPARHAAARKRGHARVEHEGQRQGDEERGKRTPRQPEQQEDDRDHEEREQLLAMTPHGRGQLRHRRASYPPLWPSRVVPGTMSGR